MVDSRRYKYRAIIERSKGFTAVSFTGKRIVIPLCLSSPGQPDITGSVKMDVRRYPNVEVTDATARARNALSNTSYPLLFDVVKRLNNGRSFGFNVQEVFSSEPGYSRKKKIDDLLVAKFHPEAIIAACKAAQSQSAAAGMQSTVRVETGITMPASATATAPAATKPEPAPVAAVTPPATDTSAWEAAKAAPPPAHGADNETDMLREALRKLLGAQDVKIDVDLIRKIAAEEAAKVAMPVHRIEIAITQADGSVTVTDVGLAHKHFPKLLKACRVRDAKGYAIPVWLPGPAGSGKTTAAMQAATALSIPFHHTGSVDTEYKLLGFIDAQGRCINPAFRKAYEFGGVFLFDEVDASHPQALVALNAALENGECAFPDGSVKRHKDCVIICAANTYGHGATHEYVGRMKLDAATLDRFTMIDWPYDEPMELALSGNAEWTRKVQKIRHAIAQKGIKHVVSPRASIRGALYLAAGFSEAEVMDMVVWKGLSADQISSVKHAAGVQ